MTADSVAVARRHAEAYASFDTAALLGVLAPDLRFRQVNPGGYLELDSAEDYLAATGEFLESFDGWESAGATGEPLGDRVATTSRLRLHDGAQSFVMQHSEVVTVSGGRVAAIDSACSGARPAV